MKRSSLFLIAALALALVGKASADPTALQLAKKGNDYIGVQSKDKVVEILSEKSVVNLAPNVWHVVYFDPDAPFKSVEVKFGGGQEMEVSHPVRPFQMPAKEVEILDPSKLKVDSDQALNIATSQSLLKSLTLRAAKLTLTHSEYGAVWKVQLWAAKLKDPNKEADVGTTTLSAVDGSIVKSDLHPGRTE